MANEFIIKNGAIIQEGSTLTVGKLSNTGFKLPTADGSSGQAMVTDGNGIVGWASVAGSPGGLNTQIQYNNNGSFGGDTGLTTDGAGNIVINGSLNIDNISINGNTISGSPSITNGDIELIPSGTGLVLAESGYDMSMGPDYSFATKGYVDQFAGLVKYERLRVIYNSGSSNPNSIDSTTPGVSATVSGTQIVVTFTGYTYPPLAAICYGYVQSGTTNVYKVQMVDSSYASNNSDFQGGGSSGSPTIFGGLTSSQTFTLIADKTRTRAASDLGESTHAWFMFTMIV